MAETKINASQTTITASDIGAAGAVTTLPTASVSEEGKIYQFTGTTDSTYTNGYFYKCVSDGAVTPTYSWSRVDVQPQGDSLPTQTGNAGKFLTTDGTDASWSDKPLVNTATGNNSLTVGGTAATNNYVTNIGKGSSATAGTCTAIGYNSRSTSSYGIAIGINANATAQYAIQIGGDNKYNSDANTFKVGNANGNFEIMSADGTIPADRLKNAINKYSAMPTAASTNEGWIVQYTGTTDSTYTHGYLYECVSDGQNPATYSWTEVQFGGGSSYTAGTGIDITSGVISVTSPTVRNYTTASDALQIAVTTPVATSTGSYSTAIGNGSYINAFNGVAIGRSSYIGTNATGSIAIGTSANCYSDKGAIIIGGGGAATQGSGTFSVSLSTTGNLGEWHTYKVVDSDGTIPTARLTKVNSTITLTAAGWSSNTQTVNVTGMTATGVVLVSPDPTDQADYTSAGILCTAQAAGTLTFTCDTVPSGDIDVNVVML